MSSPGNHQIGPFEDRYITSIRSERVLLEGCESTDLLGQLRSSKDQIQLGAVVDVEGLADADGDEGLGAEALQGEGHAAGGDVADRAERLEDAHPALGASSRVSRGRAGGEGFGAGLERRREEEGKGQEAVVVV